MNYYEFRGIIPKTGINSGNNLNNSNGIIKIETEYSPNTENPEENPNTENPNSENPNTGSPNPASPNSGSIYSEFNSDFTEILKTDPLNDLFKDELVLHTINSYPSDPLTYKGTMNSPNKYEWKKATYIEIKELIK